jgi:hypothetical protein
MKAKSYLRGLPVALAALAAVATGTALRAADAKASFSAEAANLSNVGPGGHLGRVDITITRWSTDQERETLRTALVENGTEGLLKQLQKMEPVGFIRGSDTIGWDLRYAHETTTAEGKRKIVFATDRPISWLEARNQPRTMDYRFTVGELRVDDQGKGQGQLAVAVKVNYNPTDKVLELENYASEPLRLMNVRANQ